MESIGDVLGFLVRHLAKLIKAILPSPLKEKFEPDSNLGDFIGFGMLIMLLSIVMFTIVLAAAPETTKQLKIDSCLDSGGKYNYQTNLCAYK